MHMIHTNPLYKQAVAGLSDKGIEVVSGEDHGTKQIKFRIRRGNVEAVLFGPKLNSKDKGDWLAALLSDARKTLVHRGATFPAEVQAPTLVKAAPEVAPVKKPRYSVPRHNTRLNRQEKADFYALYRSGESLKACCDAFQFSTQAGGTLIGDGDAGRFDDLLPEEYRSTYRGEPAEPKVIVGLPRAEPDPQPEPSPAPKPRVSPLDPRLLEFHKEHDLLQGHAAEVKRLAAELGIAVSVVVSVDWT